ncbi:hypothetical protein A2U01_0021202, partial [Trifolium medium]|nr:hypothetical protein [Trifolium medium]
STYEEHDEHDGDGG